MTHADLARLQMGIYGDALVKWDYRAEFTDARFSGRVFGHVWIDGATSVDFRGSVVWDTSGNRRELQPDWLEDAEAFADPLDHSVIGPHHPGFMRTIPKVWDYLKAATKGPWRVSGHSLGGGCATDLVAVMVADGIPSDQIECVTWGRPRGLFAKGAALISAVRQTAYRGVGQMGQVDGVTRVPLHFGFEAYVDCSPFVDLLMNPPANDPWSILRFHHFDTPQGYAALTPATPCLFG